MKAKLLKEGGACSLTTLTKQHFGSTLRSELSSEVEDPGPASERSEQSLPPQSHLPAFSVLGQQSGSQELINTWEKGPRCAEGKSGVTGLRARRTSPCPPVESSAGRQRPACTARSRLIPTPRGAVLVQREKDLSAYNWNSFGLRYGRRQAARAARAAARG